MGNKKQSDLDVMLAPRQRLAVDLAINKRRNVAISGSAGTGKTMCTRFLIAKIKEEFPTKGEVAVTASTGVAAKLYKGASTLHTFMGIGLGTKVAEDLAADVYKSGCTTDRLKTVKVIIIDEISMLDVDYFEKMDKVLRIVRADSKPFGGVQMIVCGDFLQLPPVEKGGDSSKPRMFQTSTWLGANFAIVLLCQSFRQTDTDFVNLLNEVRIGKLSSENVLKLQSRKVDNFESLPKFSTELHSHKKAVAEINDAYTDKLPESSEHTYAARFHVQSMSMRNKAQLADWEKQDLENMGEKMLKDCPIEPTLRLRIGSKVVYTRNDRDAGLFNGILGTVVAFTHDIATKTYLPMVHFENGKTIMVTPHMWQQISFKTNFIMFMNHLPLMRAWALTIHRVQGMTLKNVIVTIQKVFETGMMYVALSRCPSLEGLYIKGEVDTSKIIVDQPAVEFYENLEKTWPQMEIAYARSLFKKDHLPYPSIEEQMERKRDDQAMDEAGAEQVSIGHQIIRKRGGDYDPAVPLSFEQGMKIFNAAAASGSRAPQDAPPIRKKPKHMSAVVV